MALFSKWSIRRARGMASHNVPTSSFMRQPKRRAPPSFENNVAVFALKLSASRQRAGEDFAKLDEMCAGLRYELVIFINVNSDAHHMACDEGQDGDRMHSFAVTRQAGQPRISHAWWEHGALREASV